MKKNIAILIPTLTGGGAEKVAANLSLHLPEDKFQKYVIVYDDTKIDYPYGGKLVNLNSKVSRNLLGKTMNFIMRINKVRKIKKKFNIQVTISLLEGPNLVNILTKRNDKIIVSVRNFPSKSLIGFYGKLNKILMKLLYKKANTIVVVSKAIKNDLVNNFNLNEEKIKVIYNFYDIKTIQKLSEEPIEEEYKNVFEKPVIINAGRLSKQKGQWHLIRAFKKVKEEIPEVKLVILGEGELENYLRKLAVDLKLEKDIYFLGFKKNPYKYIARSSVFVFPSLYEGFPNALVEAMACGITVISSDCKSGPREILAPDTDFGRETKNNIEFAKYGVLVPVCDGKFYKYDDKLTYQEEILYKSIVNILQNPSIQKSYYVKSIKRAFDFSKENIIKIWQSEILK